MANASQRTVQRGHAFAVIDEVDSVLIDEANTPLVLSADPQGSSVDATPYLRAEELAALWNDPRVMTHVGFPQGLRVTREQLVAQHLHRAGGPEPVVEDSSAGQLIVHGAHRVVGAMKVPTEVKVTRGGQSSTAVPAGTLPVGGDDV